MVVWSEGIDVDASKGRDNCEWREEWGPNQPLETRFVLVKNELRANNSNASLQIHVFHRFDSRALLQQSCSAASRSSIFLLDSSIGPNLRTTLILLSGPTSR